MRDTLEPILGETGFLLFQFIVTFAIVLGAIALVLWLIGRRQVGKAGVTLHRGRVPRIAIVDVLEVDARRRLVLLRRDNVEHLVLVGGTNDVVVEQAIRREAQPQEPVPVDGRAAPQPAKRVTRPVVAPAARPARPVRRVEEPATPARPAAEPRAATVQRAAPTPAPYHAESEAPAERAAPARPQPAAPETAPRLHRAALPIAPAAAATMSPPEEPARPLTRFTPLAETPAEAEAPQPAPAPAARQESAPPLHPLTAAEEETDPAAEFVAAASRRPAYQEETRSTPIAAADEEIGQAPASLAPEPPESMTAPGETPAPEDSELERNVDELEQEMARLLNQISANRGRD